MPGKRSGRLRSDEQGGTDQSATSNNLTDQQEGKYASWCQRGYGWRRHRAAAEARLSLQPGRRGQDRETLADLRSLS